MATSPLKGSAAALAAGNVLAQPTPALSAGQTLVLRRIVKDPDFRKSFVDNPIDAVGKANIKITASELVGIEKLNERQFEAINGMIKSVAPNAADGTHTLAYAVAFAVVVALLIAMPNPMDIASGIQVRE